MRQRARPAVFTVATLLTAVILIPCANGQDFSDRTSRSGLTIGPEFLPGASLTFAPPEGSKLAPVFAWRGGVSATYSLTETIDASLQMGFDSRGTELYPNDLPEYWERSRVMYFGFFPNFVLNKFNIGMNIGFPVSASTTDWKGTSRNLKSREDLPVLLEARIGMVLPLYENETGWLALVFGGGASLSRLIDYPDIPLLDEGDWHMASGHLGVRYEFAIPGTSRNGK